MKKNRLTTFFLGIQLLTAASIFAVSGDAPHTFILATVGLAVSLSMRRCLSRTTRSFVYAGLIVLIAVVLEDMAFPVSQDRFFLLPARFHCPGMIFLGIAATFFDQRDVNVVSIMALGLVASMLAGNVVGVTIENPRFPLGGWILLEHFHLFYGIAIGIQVLAMAGCLPRVEKRVLSSSPGRGSLLLRRAILCGALVCVFLTTVAFRKGAIYSEYMLARTFTRFLHQYIARRSGRRGIFRQNVNLRHTVPLRHEDDRTIILRATSDQAPGYLRGMAFDQYYKGIWSGSSDSIPLRTTEPGGHYAFSRFHRGGAPEEESGTSPSINVYPSSDFRSEILPAPGNSREFELIASSILNSSDGVISPMDWDSRAGYTIHSTPAKFDSAYQGPLAENQEGRNYLRTPRWKDYSLKRLSRKIFPDSGTEQHSLLRINQLINYFNENFSYSLKPGKRRRRNHASDPIVYFLRDRRKGHCELFATAAVLLLRTQGIHARYVTGMVCSEKSPSGNHWIARLKDLHAWAEAYIPDEDRWCLVEATPTAGIPGESDDGRGTFGPVARLRERLAIFWRQALADVRRGYFAQAVTRLVMGLLGVFWSLFRNPVTAILTGGAMVWLGHRLRRRYLQRKKQGNRYLTPPIIELRRSFGIIEKKLNRAGIDRTAGTTLRELCTSLEQMTDKKQTPVLQELLGEYETLRYGRPAPAMDTVTDFRDKVKRSL